MYLGSENESLNSEQAYLIDALRYALSISPYSIPCDTSLGLELKRVSDFEDITKYKVRKLLNVIDPTGNLQCTTCELNRDVINIVVRFRSTGDSYKVSLS